MENKEEKKDYKSLFRYDEKARTAIEQFSKNTIHLNQSIELIIQTYRTRLNQQIEEFNKHYKDAIQGIKTNVDTISTNPSVNLDTKTINLKDALDRIEQIQETARGLLRTRMNGPTLGIVSMYLKQSYAAFNRFRKAGSSRVDAETQSLTKASNIKEKLQKHSANDVAYNTTFESYGKIFSDWIASAQEFVRHIGIIADAIILEINKETGKRDSNIKKVEDSIPGFFKPKTNETKATIASKVAIIENIPIDLKSMYADIIKPISDQLIDVYLIDSINKTNLFIEIDTHLQHIDRLCAHASTAATKAYDRVRMCIGISTIQKKVEIPKTKTINADANVGSDTYDSDQKDTPILLPSFHIGPDIPSFEQASHTIGDEVILW